MYYAVENCGFIPRPFRTRGTYSSTSIDDKIDDLHYYTTFRSLNRKNTYGRKSRIRNNHLNYEEGKKLIKKYDGEFPDIYFENFILLKIKKDEFFKRLDKFRPWHLWKKERNNWKLRHTANKDDMMIKNKDLILR